MQFVIDCCRDIPSLWFVRDHKLLRVGLENEATSNWYFSLIECKKCLGNHKDVQRPAVAIGNCKLGFLTVVRKPLNIMDEYCWIIPHSTWTKARLLSVIIPSWRQNYGLISL